MSTLRSLCLVGALSAGALACKGSTESPSTSGAIPNTTTRPQTPTTGTTEQPSPGTSTPPVTQTPGTSTPTTPTTGEPSQPRYSREWYVSPSGNDTAAGTQAKPLRTISKALSLVGPGEVVRVLSGTYAEKLVIDSTVRAGTANAPITLRGEGKAKLVPTSSGWYMAMVQRPYWRLENLEFDVRGARQVAVTFAGNSNGSVLANSELYGGAFGSGISTDSGARGVTLENNHIHDFDQGSTDSHGIVIAPTSQDITVRGNDIHGNSGDSVQCLGPEGFSNDTPAKGVLIEDNHLHDNRENAVDLKTCHDVTVRNNRMHGFTKSSTSRGEAVVVHYSAKNVVLEGNDISDAALGIAVGGNRVDAPPTNISVRRNRIHGLKMPEGSAIRIENGVDVRVLHNTVTGTEGFALVLGHGTGGDSTRVAVRNNLFATRNAVNLGPYVSELDLRSNVYLPRASFTTGKFFVPESSWVGDALSAWKQQGQDTASSEAAEALADAKTFAPGVGAVDKGMDLGLPYCGAAPDIGAVESGCPTAATASIAE
ncbi:right-handed parallel beta-helix repeat-containing protein [Myxococcus sp. K15C18031901]|uniref:right-handed parallel beta-helix repeat-containing protein n=1 Tax=Myxococcus dinghuensis TaxID=2906761 RepID=UPI0020A7A1A7|nr:right-handed parallel beta-helix repeat-containing protein [Myxococcus dinghuensis]MCP3103863.1 right-handed parallel beta-helix repeat-containing protein [Myxococcus dinghuensis]